MSNRRSDTRIQTFQPMIYENDDAGRPRAVYEIHSGEKRGDSSYVCDGTSHLNH